MVAIFACASSLQWVSKHAHRLRQNDKMRAYMPIYAHGGNEGALNRVVLDYQLQLKQAGHHDRGLSSEGLGRGCADPRRADAPAEPQKLLPDRLVQQTD